MMDESTGQRLSKARLAKGLSIDDVAHATKLRPDKVIALEHDDYGRFANNAYVKGFLQIYGRFLGVDVSVAMSELENPSPVSVADYQYLNSAPAKEPERLTMRRKSGRPSLAPLIVFVFLCVVVGGSGYLYLNAKRLGNLDQISASGTLIDTPAPVPAPARMPEPIAVEPIEPAPAAPPVAAIREDAAADHEFISQPSAPAADMPPETANDVVIEPIRKTWVTVRAGDAASKPIFEDFLYTNAPALKLHGPRFFIEVRDEGAVNIRKNGTPIAYQASGVTIQ